MNLLWIAIGGGLGALSRYGATLVCARLFGVSFPYGTLAVNLGGCLLIGFILGLAERGAFATPAMRLFFVTGFLGALTTFSAYAWETTTALRDGAFAAVVVNIAANNAAGLGLAMAGYWLAK